MIIAHKCLTKLIDWSRTTDYWLCFAYELHMRTVSIATAVSFVDRSPKASDLS